MKLLFLRGQVPQDRDPRQIMYDRIEENCDMWTQLAYSLYRNSYGEIWYWGGKREVVYSYNFVERWIPDFKRYRSKFKPDVIFARGGFSEYDSVLFQNPQAIKVYYGAGSRIIPTTNFKDFDLILVDTPEQLKIAKQNLPHKNICLFIKPAADNIFRMVNKNKEFDVILVGNYNKGVNKGHDFAFSIIPVHLKVISIGIVPKKIRRKYPNISYTGWIPRKNIPEYYSKSKVAIVCCGKKDSCPRVIPEALACNCPILCLNRVNVWQDKYITPETGKITTKEHFVSDLLDMVKNYSDFSPFSYYNKELSIKLSSKLIMDRINDIH
jgi:hypothetical protein